MDAEKRLWYVDVLTKRRAGKTFVFRTYHKARAWKLKHMNTYSWVGSVQKAEWGPDA